MCAQSSLGLRNRRDRYSHARDSNRQLRALPRRRVCRKPLNPLFIHSGEVCFLKKDDRGTHDPFERSACGFQDGRHVLQTLSGLLLDRIPNNPPRQWIVRPRTRHEHEPRCPYRLAVCRWRRRGVRRSNDISCHRFLHLPTVKVAPGFPQGRGQVKCSRGDSSANSCKIDPVFGVAYGSVLSQQLSEPLS